MQLRLIFMLFLCMASFAFTQEKDTVIVENEEGVNDTIVIGDNEWSEDSSDWDSHWERDWDNWDWDFDGFKGKPAISLSYGFSKLMRDDISSDFADPRLIEGKLGYATDKPFEENEEISKFSYKFFRLSNISTELSNEDFSSSDLHSSLWRFGFGKESGYGWKFGESAIIPYHSTSLDWSRLEMKNFPYEPAIWPMEKSDTKTLLKYHDSFRFGTSFEGGIKFRLISGINIEAAYERAIIFERHLFWKWAGSAVIEIASQALLDHFIDEVAESSPYVAPIVNFVLKNALSYGIYELREEKMNWPFDSAAPLSYDQFKVGMTFIF